MSGTTIVVMTYAVDITRKARKQLEKIDRIQRVQIEDAIEGLAEDPRPVGCTKLEGHNSYRIRVGNYRVIYNVFDGELVVLVVKVGHRRDVYKGYI